MPGKDVTTMNRVILMGRLTKNPEIKYAGKDNDMAVARYTLAVNRRYKRDGEQEADFISCVALMTFLSERPQITSVFLCLDNDQAGNEACEKLAGEISEGYSVIRLKPSRKDWNAILCDKNADRSNRNKAGERGKVNQGTAC